MYAVIYVKKPETKNLNRVWYFSSDCLIFLFIDLEANKFNRHNNDFVIAQYLNGKWRLFKQNLKKFN